LAALTAAELKIVAFRASADRMLTLGELCTLIAGRVPLFVEIKSRFDGDLALTRRVATVLAGYAGPVAAMSFDPDLVALLRTIAPGLTRGIVAEGHYDHAEWAALPRFRKWQLAHLAHAPRTRPHFVAWSVKDLPSLTPFVARRMFGLPVLTWTVRSEDDRARAARFADQTIFEGFTPQLSRNTVSSNGVFPATPLDQGSTP
jgi:glycerophosphoryl diester phosphodiesterase